MRKLASLILIGATTGGGVGCPALHEAMEGHKTIVAQVDGYTLTIEHAAELLASATSQVAPAVPTSVDVLTDVWVSHILLASELASADSLDGVDVAPLAQFNIDQELVWNLHRGTILTRAEPSESDLRESYRRRHPMDRVQAYHILIQAPASVTSFQQDTLRRYAEGIRKRALSGEPFEELAREFSEDPSTASHGGSLGWIFRGRLVPELEAVVFALKPGEISHTVRSRFGYHIIKVMDRESPDFDSVRDAYRKTVVSERVPQLENEYIDSLFEAARLRFTPDAAALTRELAISQKLVRLSPAERSATLLRFKGGSVNAGEVADFLLRGGRNTRRLVSDADSAQLRVILRELVRNKLLVMAARSQGYSLPEPQVDSLRTDARRELYVAALIAGFRRPALLRGENALTADVDRAIKEVLSRQRSPEPVERVSPAVRRGHVIQVHPHRFPAVAARLAEIRRAAQGTDDEVSPRREVSDRNPH